MRQLLDRLGYLALLLSGTAMAAITAIVGWQVWARYILNASPSWSEPAALLLMLYAIFFGTAWGVRNELHLGLHWFRQRLPARGQWLCACAVEAATALFAVLMIVYGAQMAEQTWRYSLPGLPLSMAWRYLPLTLGGALITLFSLEQLYRLLRDR